MSKPRTISHYRIKSKELTMEAIVDELGKYSTKNKYNIVSHYNIRLDRLVVP
jgi:hypothetical protein